MKNALLCTIAAGGLLYSGAVLAQNADQSNVNTQAGMSTDFCQRLDDYMQQNRGRDLGVDMDRLRQLQQSGNNRACRQQLAVFEDRFGRRDTAQQGGEFDQNQQQNQQFGQADQGGANARRASDGSIIVEQTPPQIRIDQPEPRVVVRQTAPNVSVAQGQPEILVHQPAPQVTVRIPQPEITVRMPQPDVNVSQQPPQVAVSQPQPQVRVRQEETQANVLMQQNQQPQVEIQQPRQQANIQVQRAGQPQVRFESEEPQVSIQQAEGNPVVRYEQMDQQASAGQNQGSQQDQAQMQARVQGQGGFDTTGSTAGTAGSNQYQVDQRYVGEDNQQFAAVGQGSAPMQSVTAEQLTGMPLLNANGNQLGEIDSIVLNPSNDRQYAVVSHGGFLGLGEKQIVLPLDSLQVMQDSVVVQGMSDQDIQNLPAYDRNAGGYQPLGDNDPLDLRYRG